MDARKLLIADSNADFLAALGEILAKQYQVFSCRSGTEALEVLRREHCGVLVLDLMLVELDGLSLLEQAVAEGLCPKVLVLTPLMNEYIQSAAERLGVAYIMYKPCDIQAAAKRAADLDHGLYRRDPRDAVSTLLASLNVSPKHRGYRYLTEAILREADDPEQSLTKVLYPAVAAVYGCDGTNVERSIRSALDAAWQHRDAAVWQTYFPVHTKRPTNAEFISRLAKALPIP